MDIEMDWPAEPFGKGAVATALLLAIGESIRSAAWILFVIS